MIFVGWVKICSYAGHDEAPVATLWRHSQIVFNTCGFFPLALCRSMRAVLSTWPVRSPSGCHASSGCFSWGLMSTQLTKMVCVPRLAPPAQVLPAVGHYEWARAGHGVRVFLSCCCKCSLVTNWFGIWVQAAEPPWCSVFSLCMLAVSGVERG